MAERLENRSLLVRRDQPLIGVILQENDQEVVRYFTEEAAADAALSPNVTQAALNVIGAWSDLDWDEMEAALDRRQLTVVTVDTDFQRVPGLDVILLPQGELRRQ